MNLRKLDGQRTFTIISPQPRLSLQRIRRWPAKIDVLRRKYKDYLWDAIFQDTSGASVTANAPVRYSVFRKKDGKRAVVVINTSATKPLEAKVDLPDHGKLVAASPENPDAQPNSGAITVPARSAMVVIEE